MTSKKLTPTKALTGIFTHDPVSSPLATASKVFVPYCSSDGWVGDAGASDKNGNLHFRGQAIVKAVFAELQRFPPPTHPLLPLSPPLLCVAQTCWCDFPLRHLLSFVFSAFTDSGTVVLLAPAQKYSCQDAQRAGAARS